MAEPYNNFLAAPERHHTVSKLLVLIVILVAIVVVVWLYSAFWNQPSGPSASMMDKQNQLRSAVTASLANPNIQPSQSEIKSLTKTLTKSNVTVTDAEREAVANQLRSSQQEF